MNFRGGSLDWNKNGYLYMSKKGLDGIYYPPPHTSSFPLIKPTENSRLPVCLEQSNN